MSRESRLSKRIARLAKSVAALGALIALPAAARAEQSLGYAEYFLLGEEAQVNASLEAVPGYRNGSGPVPSTQTPADINSRLSIVSSADNVQVYVDEWEDGYERGFGIVHNNFVTQQRTPKLSAHWYARVIRENALI